MVVLALMLAFIFEDQDLVGIKELVSTPSMILTFFFTVGLLEFKHRCSQVVRMLLPTSGRASMEFYEKIEDRIFLEEYEDPDQEFYI